VSARRELYVYYRVAEPQWREAADAVMAWQRQLCRAQPGLAARLLRRPDPRDDQVTLMETFARADGIDGALQAELARGAPALQRWLCGDRHVERFDTLD
jgi:hypothetical protein